MGLQEAVEVLPGLGHPVDDLHQVVAARAPIDLRLDQLPPQEAAEETLDRLRVVGAQHPPAARGQTMDENKAPKWALTLNMNLSSQLKEGASAASFRLASRYHHRSVLLMGDAPIPLFYRSSAVRVLAFQYSRVAIT